VNRRPLVASLLASPLVLAFAPFSRAQQRPSGTKAVAGKPSAPKPAAAKAAPPAKPTLQIETTANLERGFVHFYNLQYDEAIRWFREEMRQQPESPRPHNHLAQAVLYKVLFRAGALETQLVSGNNPFLRRAKAEIQAAEKQEFFGAVDSVMRLADAALARDANDTDAMYSRGIAFGLRANYRFLVEKAWRDALRDATEARKLHNRVAELKPSFVDARLVQGAHDYVVGSLPFFYKMLGFLVGFRGDKEAGIRTLEEVARKGVRVPYDAKVLLCAIYRREGKQWMPKAIPLLNELTATFPRNHLFFLELIQLHSDLGDEEAVNRVFATMEQRIAADPGHFHAMPAARLAYAKGNFQFWYKHYTQALENLKAATAGAEKLDLHTSVLAHMRLGQVYDVLGNRESAERAYRAAISLAPESDVATESRGYLRRPFRPTAA
jgi:tetratricopeptide (TPR) repeat protein